MVCIDEEIPFELPTGWEWCRLNSVCSKFSTGPFGTMLHKNDYVESNGVAVINPTNISTPLINCDNIKMVSTKKYEELLSYKVEEGDIILARRGDLSKCAIITAKENGWLAGTGAFFLRVLNLNLKIFTLLYTSDYIQSSLLSDSVGTTMDNLNQTLLANILLPIPPLQEQSRIVDIIAKIEPKINDYDSSKSKLDKLNSTIKDLLKKSILQEAIQGKLIPQNSADEPACELLKRTREEKERLIKEKKIKRDKNESIIFRGDDNSYYEKTGEHEQPVNCDFCFPRSWETVKLGQICQLTDGEKTQGKQVCLDAKYLRGKSESTYLEQGRLVKTGDNIILVDGENSGEVFTVPIDGYMGSTFKQLWISSELYQPYILYVILFYKDLLRNSKKGAAIPHLNREIFNNLIIGVPPLQEQQRIVEKIEELFKLCK